MDAEVKAGDRVVFISTLHGGGGALLHAQGGRG